MGESLEMDTTDSLPREFFWQKDSFRLIKPDDFEGLGIDPTDIPLGTFAALKHPSHLPSKFGGNAYGFGLFEVYDRIRPKDVRLLRSITIDDPEDIRNHYKELNEIYAKIGLLIRFSSLGNPYYLIPVHLVSDTFIHIKSKVDEITKIVGYHRRKYFKEYHDIGLVTHEDDLIIRELSFRYKEHNFVIIDSLGKLQGLDQTLDLVILTRDLYEIILMEKFSPLSQEMLSKKRLEQYAVYMLWKLYNVLKPDGEIFIISNEYTPKTNSTTKITFKTEREKRNFSLFTHIFKTKKKYKIKGNSLLVSTFDFQKYLSGLYVEQEIVDNLLAGRKLGELTLQQINNLPYLNFQLTDLPFLSNQEKIWSRLLSIYFDRIFLKPLVPQTVSRNWGERFSFTDYAPNYMMIYLGQKRPLKTKRPELMRDVMESRLSGCPQDLLPDYRDAFDYVIQTLQVLERLKDGSYKGLPEIFIDRLRQPLVNKNRRFTALNDVIKLIGKVKRLETVRDYLNPDKIEGSKTKVLKNLEALTFFGFNHNELREIVYMVLGHTSFGRIISGKMSEKAFKPVLDLARTYDIQQAINLLRYCRLMTMAETEAAGGSELRREQLAELFDFYESAVRVVSNPALDWQEVLDEKISSMGGIHNKVIRKVLKMMNYYEFLDNWSELGQKGRMEKESLADYDDLRLSRIENVIRLIETVEEFEESYLKSDPLQLPVFYRKILDKEFHGTGYIFENMDSRLVFILLSISANLARSEIINFNPLLGGAPSSEIDERVKKVEEEARGINIHYVDYTIMRQFGKQLYRYGSSFVLGTGFQIKVDPETQALEIGYMDVDKGIDRLESLIKKAAGCPISEIPLIDLKDLEFLFSNLESFYQSHLRFLDEVGYALKLPTTQKQWFQRTQELQQHLRSNFLSLFFSPKDVYTNLDLFYHQAPTLLNFILPEFMALQGLQISWHLYMKSPVIHYIISATRKLQALITHDRESFQDPHFLHRLAQKEFGPMATGIVGVNESQLDDLEKMVDNFRHNRQLFNALIKSLIFQDLGRLPALREKYADDINPSDLAQASALFIEKEEIAQSYNLDEKEKAYLVFLVRHHSLMHHIVRGEFSVVAVKDIFGSQDKNLFDAFFVFSFIMLSAIRDDLILEDLADQLFRINELCNRVIDGEGSLEEQLDEVFAQSGNLLYALEAYQREGLPDGVSPSQYLESKKWGESEKSKRIQAGKKIFSLERIFRLRGIRYVGFLDLVNLMIKIPLKFIYKQRKLSSIGYATFEKEILEAFRIYNTLQNFSEETWQFILNQLVDDNVRIFGYEKVSGYLSYENQIKLLLFGLLATRRFRADGSPICLNYLGLCEKIEKRYEAVNDFLNTLHPDTFLEHEHQLDQFFKAKAGLVLKKEKFPNVCTLDFQDRVNISQKASYMAAIDNVEQLKTYYHYSLRSLRKHPFNTEDYELQLEKLFEDRATEITDMILNQTKIQMDLIHDFKELHNLVSDLFERSWDLGFSEDQKHRLNDLYELRKDSLKREKLSEIDNVLGTINEPQELKDYWNSIKWYLQSNRRLFGKEYEHLIAKRFDEAGNRIGG